MSLTVAELERGISYWLGETTWDRDFTGLAATLEGGGETFAKAGLNRRSACGAQRGAQDE